MKSPDRQRGAALAISLMLLLGLVLVGVVATRTAVLEQRMARNQMSVNLAFQSSETALRDAELFLDQLQSLPHEVVCTTAACNTVSGVENAGGAEVGSVGTIANVLSSDDTNFDSTAELIALTLDNWDNHGQALKSEDADGNAIQLSGVARQPRYIIIEQRFLPDGQTMGTGVPPGRYLYQITANGAGQREATTRVLQSTFIRRY